MKMSWGSSKSPGAEPLCPQVLMNRPSFENFTTRAELCWLGAWPSVTKISPLGAIATPVGRSKVSGPFPDTPSFPIVISTLPAGLNLRTSWPMITPSAFLADMPSTVASSFTSLTHRFPSPSMVKP